MKAILSVLTSSLVGVVFGILANYTVLQGSWFNLVVWALVGLLIGAFIEEARFIRWSGICYGTFLTAAFLVSGFQGSADKIPAFTLLTLVLCVVGAFCGWCLVVTGNWLKRKMV
jgi:hypothetical protein